MTSSAKFEIPTSGACRLTHRNARRSPKPRQGQSIGVRRAVRGLLSSDIARCRRLELGWRARSGRRGTGGGIELLEGFRTRLSGLTEDEVEALGILLQAGTPAADSFGLGEAARRLRLKLISSLPSIARDPVYEAESRFLVELGSTTDSTVTHLADAIPNGQIIFATRRSRASNSGC